MSGKGVMSGSPIYSNVAATKNRVLVTTNNGHVVALDAGTGQQVWTVETESEFGASGPAVANGTVYVAGDKVYALNVTDGTEVWNSPFEYGRTVGSTPTVVNGTVYVGSADGYLYAINTSDGTEKWQFEADGGIATNPSVTNGRVVFASLAGSVYLLDPATGDELTSETVSGEVRSSPILSDYDVYLGTEHGVVCNFVLKSNR